MDIQGHPKLCSARLIYRAEMPLFGWRHIGWDKNWRRHPAKALGFREKGCDDAKLKDEQKLDNEIPYVHGSGVWSSSWHDG